MSGAGRSALALLAAGLGMVLALGTGTAAAPGRAGPAEHPAGVSGEDSPEDAQGWAGWTAPGGAGSRQDGRPDADGNPQVAPGGVSGSPRAGDPDVGPKGATASPQAGRQGVPGPAVPVVVDPAGPGLAGGLPPDPVPVGTGVDALLRGPDLRGDRAPTLYERYGTGGYTLDTDLRFDEAVLRAVNAVAGALFALAIWIASAVAVLVQWAFTVDLTGPLHQAVADLVGVLRQALYTPLLGAVVLLAGAYALWHGLVRHRGTLAAQGLAWSVAALVVGAVFLAQPGPVVQEAASTTVGLSRAVLAGVAGLDTRKDPQFFGGDPADAELRAATDRFWRVFIHRPWLVAELGDPALGATYGERLLGAKTLTAEETRRARAAPAEARALREAKHAAYRTLRTELRSRHPDAYAWFSGRRATERVGIAAFTLLTVGGLGGLLGLLAGAVIVVQLAFLLLVVAAPAFLLLAVHPGAGRVLAVRWAELLVATLIKRVLYAALLAVLLVLGGVLLELSARLGWGAAATLQILLLAAAVLYRRHFRELLSTVSPPTVAAAASPEGSPPGRRQAAASRPAPRPRPGIPHLPEPEPAGIGGGGGPPAQPARPDAGPSGGR